MTVDGEAEPVPAKRGVWRSNTGSRRDKLTAEQRAALAALGMEWAGAVLAIESAPGLPASQPAPPAAPARRRVAGSLTLIEGAPSLGLVTLAAHTAGDGGVVPIKVGGRTRRLRTGLEEPSLRW